jgi:hypothetical protein
MKAKVAGTPSNRLAAHPACRLCGRPQRASERRRQAWRLLKRRSGRS